MDPASTNTRLPLSVTVVPPPHSNANRLSPDIEFLATTAGRPDRSVWQYRAQPNHRLRFANPQGQAGLSGLILHFPEKMATAQLLPCE